MFSWSVKICIRSEGVGCNFSISINLVEVIYCYFPNNPLNWLPNAMQSSIPPLLVFVRPSPKIGNFRSSSCCQRPTQVGLCLLVASHPQLSWCYIKRPLSCNIFILKKLFEKYRTVWVGFALAIRIRYCARIDVKDFFPLVSFKITVEHLYSIELAMTLLDRRCQLFDAEFLCSWPLFALFDWGFQACCSLNPFQAISLSPVRFSTN